MKETINHEIIKQGNISFMQSASYMMNNSALFFDTLQRAESFYERARYDGLQSLPLPQGFIFVEPAHATGLLSAIYENKNLLKEFAIKVAKVSEGEYIVRDDCSRIEVPFKDKFRGNYKIALDIFEYTLGAEESFKPVKSLLGLPQFAGIERLANLEFVV